jgi:hypothetical protein
MIHRVIFSDANRNYFGDFRLTSSIHKDMELSMDFTMILTMRKKMQIELYWKASQETQAAKDFIAETMAIKKLINERNGHQPESTKHIIELLNKFKEIAGIDKKNILGMSPYQNI